MTMHEKRWIRRPEGSNWGDFGEADRLGRLNLLGPDRVLRGMQEVKEGRVFSLSLPLTLPGEASSIGRQPPRWAASVEDGCHCNFHRPFTDLLAGATGYVCDDMVTLHTQYSTQWDGLGHVGVDFDAFGDGKLRVTYYGGFQARDIQLPDTDGSSPTNPLGIENVAKAGVQGRAVLVNLRSMFGDRRVVVGYDAWMEALRRQNIQVERGDMVCIYTGYSNLLLQMKGKPDHDRLRQSCSALDGSDQRLLNWITENGVVALCADNNAVEIVDRGSFQADSPKPFLPLHEHCLFKLGVYLGELWHLRELAEALESSGRSAFLLTAPPLHLPGAFGSPVTPIATI